MSMVDSRAFQPPPRNAVLRKPLPPTSAAPPGVQTRHDFQPDQAYLPQHLQQPQQQQPQSSQQFTHSRSRTASSSIFPMMSTAGPQHPPPPTTQQHPYQPEYPVHNSGPGPQQAVYPPVRTSSRATDSTSSMSNYTSQRSVSSGVPMRQNSGASSSLERSVSSRSNSSASSYVAMMRKQKATVWSDRAQYQDPRLKNQQRIAKMHARAEMSGAASMTGARVSSGSSSLTGGVRSKIRHHGAPKAQQFASGGFSAGGVPIRLSENEIDEDDSEEGSQAGTTLHRRTDSGRSSLASAGRTANAYGLHGQQIPPTTSNTTNSPPPQGEGLGSAEETPVPDHFRGPDYFSQPPPSQQKKQQQANSGLERAGSGGSGSTDRENSFGAAGSLPQRVQAEQDNTLDPAELRRRGSVDERTMTMSGYGKLFVANPDVDD